MNEYQNDSDFMLLHVLENVEFCNLETGEYFRAVAVHNETTGKVIIIEKID